VVLPARPRALAVAPDGDHAYALTRPVGPLRRSTELVQLDLRLGVVRPLGSVPGSGTGGLAVAGGRLYVPDPEGDAVAVLDRRTGAPLPPLKAGRGPVGIARAGGEGPAPPGA
jgi:DNA-binding beta-propeller fold protein YncE